MLCPRKDVHIVVEHTFNLGLSFHFVIFLWLGCELLFIYLFICWCGFKGFEVQFILGGGMVWVSKWTVSTHFKTTLSLWLSSTKALFDPYFQRVSLQGLKKCSFLLFQCKISQKIQKWLIFRNATKGLIQTSIVEIYSMLKVTYLWTPNWTLWSNTRTIISWGPKSGFTGNKKLFSCHEGIHELLKMDFTTTWDPYPNNIQGEKPNILTQTLQFDSNTQLSTQSGVNIHFVSGSGIIISMVLKWKTNY